MAARKIESFEEFWPHYVAAHKHPLNRALHYVGTSCAIACATVGVLTLNPLLLIAAPVVGYAPAWIGHFLIEGNKPASFDYARLSLIGDFKMLRLALRRKMGDELTRLFGTRRPSRDTPLAGFTVS